LIGFIAVEDRPREGLAAIVLAFDAALRRGEVDLALASLAENGVLLVPSRPPLVGTAAMRPDLAALAAELADFPAERPAVLVDGARAIVLLEDAAGEQAPIAEIFSFEGDRIRQLRVLFDTASK
jgi:ketosteroid isomerase-like protein